jgi:acyl transferase domain-containing protein
LQGIYRASNITPCCLGSVKPNIGHTLCAEGIAAFIKVVLMLHHRKLPPFLSGEQPPTHFDLKTSPFYFTRKLSDWDNPVRTAALNCFADGGTNAHLILESWEHPAGLDIKRRPLPPPQLDPQTKLYTGLSCAPERIPKRDDPPDDPGNAEMIWKTLGKGAQ